MRLRVGYETEGRKIQAEEEKDNPEGVFLEIKGLSEKMVDEIRNYW